MNEQSEEPRTDLDGWPIPTRDVLRELEQHAVAWPEPWPGAETTPRYGSA